MWHSVNDRRKSHPEKEHSDKDSEVKPDASKDKMRKPATNGKTYKSWKKKYRKMRIHFDGRMHEGEELHKQEANASATVKRLAVENE